MKNMSEYGGSSESYSEGSNISQPELATTLEQIEKLSVISSEGSEDGFVLSPTKLARIQAGFRASDYKNFSDDDPDLDCIDEDGREVYVVSVAADSIEASECIEILKGIGRESGFIRCSTREDFAFYAFLDEKEADALEGDNRVCSAYALTDIFVEH